MFTTVTVVLSAICSLEEKLGGGGGGPDHRHWLGGGGRSGIFSTFWKVWCIIGQCNLMGLLLA